MSNHQAVEFL